MNITAKISGIEYDPAMCRQLRLYPIHKISEAIQQESAFLLETESQKSFAISHWVSPKRTRSYPYARIYDTLGFHGKRVTVIPVMKDEGNEGDRDFIQYDTLTLMGLLGIHVIISYYKDAEKSDRYANKITAQILDSDHIVGEIRRLEKYQSDALHWNMQQVENIGQIAQKALEAYRSISERLNVKLHSFDSATRRLDTLHRSREAFINQSRLLAREAQQRETKTLQPKEQISAKKATLTIQNFLGGIYYFTCDEVYTRDNNIFLIEAKHSRNQMIPSLEDIKDGLLRMVLLTNLREVAVNQHLYSAVAILRLTSEKAFDLESLSPTQKELLRMLKLEAENNQFYVIINETNLNRLE